jgi:secreted trypsin-like serine protease
MNMGKFRSFAACLLILCATGCSEDNDDNGGGDDLRTDACSTLGLDSRIINGTACEENNSPVVRINLVNADGQSSLCSGSMITDNDVLTAAHCVVTSRIVSATVRVNGREVSVRRITPHPGVRFDETAIAIFNDVAILELSESVSLPTLPIILSRPIGEGDRFSIYGYGRDDNDNLDVLRSGDSRVGSVTDQHIIAAFDGETGSNSCNGDSGGPAVQTIETSDNVDRTGIVGLVSSGNNPNCTAGDISLYANVQGNELRDFILATVPDASVI